MNDASPHIENRRKYRVLVLGYKNYENNESNFIWLQGLVFYKKYYLRKLFEGGKHYIRYDRSLRDKNGKKIESPFTPDLNGNRDYQPRIYKYLNKSENIGMFLNAPRTR